MRVKSLFVGSVKLYKIEHYMASKPANKSKKDVIEADVSKQFTWTMQRDLPSDKVRKALQDTFAQNGYKDGGKIGQFLGAFSGEELKEAPSSRSSTTRTRRTSSSPFRRRQGDRQRRRLHEGCLSIWFGVIDQPGLGDALISAPDPDASVATGPRSGRRPIAFHLVLLRAASGRATRSAPFLEGTAAFGIFLYWIVMRGQGEAVPTTRAGLVFAAPGLGIRASASSSTPPTRGARRLDRHPSSSGRVAISTIVAPFVFKEPLTIRRIIGVALGIAAPSFFRPRSPGEGRSG